MLSALERFRFASFEHGDFFFAGSKSRKVNPVMLIAQLNQPVQEEMVVVSYTTKVDALIRVSNKQHTNQSFFFNPLVQTKHVEYKEI